MVGGVVDGTSSLAISALSLVGGLLGVGMLIGAVALSKREALKGHVSAVAVESPDLSSSRSSEADATGALAGAGEEARAQSVQAKSPPESSSTPEPSSTSEQGVADLEPSTASQEDEPGERERLNRELKEAHQALSLKYEALKSERDALLKREQVKVNFFTNTCHDLRTPLSSIRGNNELLIRGHFGPVNQSQLRSLETTQRNLDRLLLMLDRLLELSRDQRDVSMLPSSESFDLVQLLNDILELFNVPARDKGVDLKWRCYARVMPVRADRVQLHRILTNLLGNALKFTDKGGHIRVQLRWAAPDEATRASMQQAATELRPNFLDDPGEGPRRWLLLRVVDTGRGIPSQALESIFERWTTTEGHGLGLSITRRYVQHHGGLVEVNSQESRGTSFSIWMPIGVKERELAALDAAVEKSSRRRDRRLDAQAPRARDAQQLKPPSSNSGSHKLRPLPARPPKHNGPDSRSILPERQTGGITIKPFQVLEHGAPLHAQQARLDKSALDFSSSSVVLVLDDDPDVLDFFAMVLQSQGCEVIPVQSVEALRQAVTDITPDAMLLDYYLKGQPCVEKLAWLTEDPRLKDIPKMIVSGRDDEVVREGARSLDAQGVLRKPCGVDELLSTVERLTRLDTDVGAP